ncbi:MAG: hypothetical protein NXI18_08970 [Alphaproteobacteria bacterium]|nr:hypothetical protein [Alphaproteobacteria bacterium]
MSPPPNAETINDRAKLLTHRIIARQIATDPDLIDRARRVLSEWRSMGHQYAVFDEWDRLLNLDPVQLRRQITERSENMTRLRISSPLGIASGLFVNDEALRRRIRRKAMNGLLLIAKRRAEADPSCSRSFNSLVERTTKPLTESDR